MSSAGFTLAEVLITLAIIGIVAALTIPGLITKIKDIHYRSAYKKAYSNINQALKLALEDGEILNLSTESITDETHFTSECGENFKVLAKYFNAPMTCFNGDNTLCWEYNGEAGYANSVPPTWLGHNKSSYAFIDLNGTAWTMYFNYENAIIVDVNGKRKPNQLGRDRFVLRFTDSQNQGSKYDLNEINSIMPIADVIAKERWCPQGNCLYKSWLQK